MGLRDGEGWELATWRESRWERGSGGCSDIVDLMAFREKLGLGGLNLWGLFGENAIARGRFCTLGPGIGGDQVVDGGGLGVEGKEVVSEEGESRTAKAGVEVGGGVGFDDGLIGEVQAFFLGEIFFREEVAGVGNVAFGPSDLVHLGEVFDQVGVGVEASLDLAEVDDEGSGKLFPDCLNDFVGDIGGTDHQVIMGPTAASEFGDTEVFDGVVAGA